MFSGHFLVDCLAGFVLIEILVCCFALTEVLGCCFALTGVLRCCFSLPGVFLVVIAFTFAPFWVFDIFCTFCLFVIFKLLELAELFVFGGLVVVLEHLVLIFIALWGRHKLYLSVGVTI